MTAPLVRTSVWTSVRVASVATLIAGVIYALAAGGIVLLLVRNVTAQVDDQLAQQLEFARHDPHPGRPAAIDSFNPLQQWWIGPEGSVLQARAAEPDLPGDLRRVSSPVTRSVGGDDLRLAGEPVVIEGYYVVVGESVSFISKTAKGLAVAELIAAVPILLVIFLAAFTIGRRSSAPVERAHRRLLAFTADASHELRTPLQVIEAEVSLALLKDRDAGSYRDVIQRIGTESGRLRRLIDDLLWLARFDSQPGPPRADLVDLNSLASNAVERFEAVAQRRGQSLELVVGPGPSPVVSGPREWLDRLLGVLLDNACHYTPEGGYIVLHTAITEGRVELAVDDSGPGIPPSEREKIFERFHRATAQAGGAGLGLAIGNAIVQATSGRWDIGQSSLGGARLAVRWPAVRRFQEPNPAAAARQAGPHRA